MNKKAFTFIELIVVMSMIILITGGGIFYFFRHLSSIQLESEVTRFVDIVDSLDRQIQTKKILDYNILLDTSSGRKGFIYTTNNLGLNEYLEASFNSDTGQVIVSTTESFSGRTYISKLYAGIKFQDEAVLDVTDQIIKTLDKNQSYKFTGSLSGAVLNNVHIQYYSKDNIDSDTGNDIELISIKNIAGTVSYSTLLLVNTNGQKVLLGDGTINMSEAIVTFERKGQPYSFKISL